MITRSTYAVFLALSASSTGCPDQIDFNDSGSATSGNCAMGGDGCPCLNGLCAFGLACESNVCIDHGSGGDGPPPPATEESGSADGGNSESESESGGGPGSCAGHCGQGVADGDGMCFCTATCATLGTCCADYDATCPVSGACGMNEECDDVQVCSAGSHECVQAYGSSFDVYISYEDDTGICWDMSEASCEPDPYFIASLASAIGICDIAELLHSSELVHDDRTVGWQKFSYAPSDGDVLSIAVVDYDSNMRPYGPAMMPEVCCQVVFQGDEGAVNLHLGEGSCTSSGGVLNVTLVAQ